VSVRQSVNNRPTGAAGDIPSQPRFIPIGSLMSRFVAKLALLPLFLFAALGLRMLVGRITSTDPAATKGTVNSFPPDSRENFPQALIPTQVGNVGEIPRGKRATFKFVIENRGKGPLEISAKPHCGCTVVDYDKVIQPGKQGVLKTELRTSDLRGVFKKSVEVKTNDPAHKSLQFVLTGSVIQAVEMVPSSNPSIALKLDGPTVHELELQTSEQVEVTGATCRVPYAQAKLERNGDRKYRLSIIIQPDAPLGRSNFVMILSTTAEHERSIPVTVYCDKGVVVTPQNFVFGGQNSKVGMVVLKKRDAEVHIRSAVSSDPDLDVKVSTIKEGSLYRLIATCKGQFSSVDPSTVITVETDDPQQPRLVIPVKLPATPATPAAQKTAAAVPVGK
jgi:hypothetical protein